MLKLQQLKVSKLSSKEGLKCELLFCPFWPKGKILDQRITADKIEENAVTRKSPFPGFLPTDLDPFLTYILKKILKE